MRRTTASGIDNLCIGSPQTVPDESVPLQFVDLLYAVPVADLAVRVSATHLDHVSPSGWTDLAVQLSAITFGWIGHHTNRAKLPRTLTEERSEGRQFLTLRFPQLVVEILIIVAYFALGTKSFLPDAQGIGHPSEAWKGLWLTVIFGLYLIWDLLDVWIAETRQLVKWRKRAWRGLKVTAVFTAIIGIGLWLAWASGYHQAGSPYGSVVGFDLCAIAILFAYRATGELVKEAAEHGLTYALTFRWIKRPPGP
jgi:hypothetical protein